MKHPRRLLLVVSWGLAAFLLGGAFVVRGGEKAERFDQPVLFAEIVSLVLENYVDTVDADQLLRGAYEGLLGGLDPNGAYLDPDELREWKSAPRTAAADPGLSVLKSGGSLAVVAVDPGSPAETAGVEVGDRIRTVDGRKVAELSLEQGRRLLRGEAGSRVAVGLVRAGEEFQVEELELVRRPRTARAFEIEVRGGTAVLRVRDVARVVPDALASELGEVHGRGIARLLIDVRDAAEGSPRDAVGVAALFVREPVLELRGRGGDVVQTLRGPERAPAWAGSVAVLVNHATAGAAEALAEMLRASGQAQIFGGKTFGLGGETDLVELDNGAGLLISASQWEVPQAGGWNGEGVTPDREVAGIGRDAEAVSKSQLERVLELLQQDAANPEKAAA